MGEFHQGNGLCHMCRLIGIQRQGLPACRVAELTAPGADISPNHEGCGAFPPTFPHIGATAAAADGMEAMRFDNAFGLGIALVGTEAYVLFRALFQFFVEEVGQPRV